MGEAGGLRESHGFSSESLTGPREGTPGPAGISTECQSRRGLGIPTAAPSSRWLQHFLLRGLFRHC